MAKKRKAKTPSIKKQSGELDFGKPHPVFSKMVTEELKAVDLDSLGPQEEEYWKFELQRRDEQLDHKLLRHLDVGGQFGPILKHPLYVGHVNLNRAAWVNWAISYKQRVLKGWMAAHKWRKVVFGHEQLFYDQAFRKYLKHFDDKSYWEILSIIWTQQEQLWPKRKWFLQLF